MKKPIQCLARFKAVAFLIVSALVLNAAATAGIAPTFTGNGAGDSVCLTFTSIDTTYYPEVTDLDSFDILRFRPDGSLLDSTSEDGTGVTHPTKGFYRACFRASDGSAATGIYSIVVRGWLAGKERGVLSENYEVSHKGISPTISEIDSLRDSLYAILDTIQSGFGSRSRIGDTISRDASTLTTSDNIGLNWADIENSSAVTYLSNTVLSGVQSVDTASISRSVWNDNVIDPSNRRIRYVDSTGSVVSIPSFGTGAYACSLYYRNDSDTAAIGGVFCRVMNGSQTATCAIGMTNADGLVVMSLDSEDYCIWSSKTGVVFQELPSTLVINAPSTADTVWGSLFDPGEPSSPSLCRVYGWVRNLAGEAIHDVTITAEVKQDPLRSGTVLIAPHYRSVETDSSGYWFLDLIPSGDLDPESTDYTFSIHSESGVIGIKKVRVPSDPNWELQW